MKKLIILTLVIALLCVPFVSSGMCLAEQDGYIYYYTAEEIPVFKTADGGEPIFYIPSTYAYKFVSEVQGKDYIKIEYNGIKECYIYKEDYISANKVKTDWQGNYYYVPSFTLASVESVNIYADQSLTKPTPYFTSSFVLNKIHGYTHKDGVYYFYINYTYGASSATDAYIKASDTTLPDFNKDSIAQNPYYLEETTPETPSGDNGNVNNDGLQTPTNNLERYLLIAVIAILCVIIVVLIFIPNKRRKSD